MLKNFLNKIQARVRGGAHLFGVESKWNIMIGITIFACVLAIGGAYYVWYIVANDESGASGQIPSGSRIHVFDQKKLQMMIADLDAREREVFGGMGTTSLSR